jgi:fatty acid desaturase
MISRIVVLACLASDLPRASALLASRLTTAPRLAARRLAPAVTAIATSPEKVDGGSSAARRSRGRLNVRIDDKWYDLTNWRAAHPAGAHWIDAYNNSDATEVMYGFHSDEGIAMLKRLPESKTAPTDVPPPTPATYSFRKFRQQLVDDGWYKPHVWGEVKKLAPWLAAAVSGVLMARRATNAAQTMVSVALLAVANTLAGWLAHDYVHGRSRFSWLMRPFGELIGAMSTSWWSAKHNMHHALTNEVGYDEDIALEPAIYLWRPDPKNDVRWLRKFQHVYWPLPFSVLFHYWRFDSLVYAWKFKKWGELSRLVAHWAAVLALIPAKTLFFSVWLSGFLTATIVTVTHQSEEIFFGENLRKYDFIEAQFRSTRNAKCNNPFSHILWGGMQWQLEHHIFPTMPRYKYPAVSKLLQKWAGENGLDYRISGEFEIIRQNIDLLKDLANAEPQEGNPDSTPAFKQI